MSRSVRETVRRRAQRRRRLRRGAVVVLVLALVGGGLALLRQPDNLRGDRRGSELVADDGSVLTSTREPESYEIVYRSVETATDDPVTTTEHIRVRRPFAARIDIKRGGPPGGDTTSERVTRFGVLGTPGHDGRWTLFSVPPAVAGSDVRPAAVLADAVDEGALQVRERRRVLGRECQVYRAGGVLSSGNLVPYEPEGAEYADACIDEAGLVLEEIWVDKGRRLTRKVATSVEEDVDLPDDLFEPAGATALGYEDGGGLVQEVDPATMPSSTTFWTLDEPPAGFEHRGRYSIVPARLDPFRQSVDPADDPRGTASVADVWVRGPDLLVVDQGIVTSAAGAIPDHPHARAVDVGELGDAQAFLDLRSSEVRAQPEGGGFVRVYGTLALDELISLTRALRPVETSADGLRFLDE